MRDSEATTLETLSEFQIRELLAILDNPRHKMIASRTRMFRRLGLVIPTEPPRAPLDSRARKAPPGRAHKLTKLCIDTLSALGRLPQLTAEASP